MTDPDNAPRRLPTWRELHRDTDPQTEAVLFAIWRETSAWGKLQMMGALNQAAREALSSRVRRRNPAAPPAEIRWLLANELLGSDLAAEVHGPLPSAEVLQDERA